MSTAADYQAFLEAKVVTAPLRGFAVTSEDVNPRCQPHVRAIVPWMVRLVRAACFSRFGLQKTVTQLEAVRLTRERSGGRGLIVCPLGVRQEFRRDAVERLGWPAPPKFIRSIEEADDPDGIYLANYETVRDGKLDPQQFEVASLDEAAVLRGFGGTKDVPRVHGPLRRRRPERRGLMTVPYCAVKLRRRGVGVELATRYFADGAAYCAAAARELATPSLFDLTEQEA